MDREPRRRQTDVIEKCVTEVYFRLFNVSVR